MTKRPFIFEGFLSREAKSILLAYRKDNAIIIPPGSTVEFKDDFVVFRKNQKNGVKESTEIEIPDVPKKKSKKKK